MSLQIHTLPALKDNYIYILESGGRCAVVDPGEAGCVRKFLNTSGLKLTDIFCTHHHWDHVGGAKELADTFGAAIWASKPDLSRIDGATREAVEGPAYDFAGHPFRVLEIPGHTLGQIGYWFESDRALFAGDTLFSCGCGRLFEGSAEQMFASLAKIKKLPEETRLYFGHEYTLRNVDFVLAQGRTSLELLNHRAWAQEKIARHEPTSPGLLREELKINPFLMAKTVDEFRNWRQARDVY